MTVCIAAIAEAQTEYPKIVFAADREVTSWISYTSGVGKIRAINDFTYVMISTNNALLSNDIITKTIEYLSQDEDKENLKVENIAEIISYECKRRLEIAREESVLRPHGLTYDSFIARSQDLSSYHMEIISNSLKNFEEEDYSFKVDFLLVGIDSQPHIFVINQKGDYVSNNTEGFAVIGSGTTTAFPEMTKYPYSPNDDWLYVLHRVYNSKRIAERVGGVGYQTDLVVLHRSEEGNTNIWIADDDKKNLLDSAMEQVIIKEREIYSSLLKELNHLLISSEDYSN